MKPVILTALVLILLSSPLIAEEEGKLDGGAGLNEENCAKGVRSPECRMSFQIFGKTAETLFKSMKARSIKDECIEGETKEDKSGLSCSKEGDGTYRCDFSYSFAKQSFGKSDIDC
jgi:hypothetical protein